jgi:hypothetical protein
MLYYIFLLIKYMSMHILIYIYIYVGMYNEVDWLLE